VKIKNAGNDSLNKKCNSYVKKIQKEREKTPRPHTK